MLLLTYLRHELRRRLRQTILVSFGLAVGIGPAITVTAVSAGVHDAQDTALANLYGVGTDITVTAAADGPGDQTAANPLLERPQSASQSRSSIGHIPFSWSVITVTNQTRPM